jgi:hypothetical protein
MRRVFGIALAPVFFARMAASPICRDAATAVLAFAPARRERAMKHSVRSGPDIASQDCALAARGDVITAAANAATPISIKTAVAAWRSERRRGWSFTTRDFDHPTRRMSRPTVPGRSPALETIAYMMHPPHCARAW